MWYLIIVVVLASIACGIGLYRGCRTDQAVALVHADDEQAAPLNNAPFGIATLIGLVVLMPVSVWGICLLYTSPSPRDLSTSRMPSSA